MPVIHHPLLEDLLVAAGAVAVVALLLVIAAHVRVSRLRRSLAVLDGPEGPETVLATLARSRDEVGRMRQELATAQADVTRARSELADALRHVAVVRYDAFNDMGGRLSFTAALLDDSGDGMVLTSINGRTEARSYAKGVKSGASEQELSPEEAQAIDLALGRAPRG